MTAKTIAIAACAAVVSLWAIGRHTIKNIPAGEHGVDALPASFLVKVGWNIAARKLGADAVAINLDPDDP